MVLADAVPLLLGPLFLVSGLIPSVMFANKQATSTLVDAISGAPPPSTDSPPLRSAPLLFYPEPPRVADVLAVMARLDSAGLKKSSGSVPSVLVCAELSRIEPWMSQIGQTVAELWTCQNRPIGCKSG